MRKQNVPLGIEDSIFEVEKLDCVTTGGAAEERREYPRDV